MGDIKIWALATIRRNNYMVKDMDVELVIDPHADAESLILAKAEAIKRQIGMNSYLYGAENKDDISFDPIKARYSMDIQTIRGKICISLQPAEQALSASELKKKWTDGADEKDILASSTATKKQFRHRIHKQD